MVRPKIYIYIEKEKNNSRTNYKTETHHSQVLDLSHPGI